MITLQKITTADKKEYSYMEKLYIMAFPEEERRELALQKEITDNNPLFHNNLILHKGIPIGFITYWIFDKFYYIEHFAIDPEQRNGGFGKKVLLHIQEQFTLPTVLEVERPIDEISSRRINFYKRMGYKLWEQDYWQPPYKENAHSVPMYLMISGDLQPEKDFEGIKRILYKNVYRTSYLP